MLLSPKRFGLAGGIINGLWMFIFTLVAIWTGYGMGWMEMMKPGFPGYEVTLIGSVIGAAWGFVYWFICFYIFAWVYNWLATCCK